MSTLRTAPCDGSGKAEGSCLIAGAWIVQVLRDPLTFLLRGVKPLCGFATLQRCQIQVSLRREGVGVDRVHASPLRVRAKDFVLQQGGVADPANKFLEGTSSRFRQPQFEFAFGQRSVSRRSSVTSTG